MRLVGEEVLQEDPLKTELYPHADRAIVSLMHGHNENDHTRTHLVAPTVMIVAAAADFNATLDRPRGVALLRQVADLLERQQLASIPWGPKNKAHKSVVRELIDGEMLPKLDYDDGADGMFSLMRLLEAEFGEAVDKLLERFAYAAEGAEEAVVMGFLVQFLFKRYGEIETPENAKATVRHAAIDQGWIDPE